MTEHGNKGKKNALIGGKTMDSGISIRCHKSDKGSWVHEAISKKMKLAAWVQETLNAAVTK